MRRLLGYISNIIIVVVGAVALFVLGSLLPIEGNYQFRTVESGSMEPAIKTGSVVAIIPAADYQPGDIVTFRGTAVNPTPTTHRIVAEDDGVFTTKGDANEEPDYRTVTEEEMIGKVFLTVPYTGYLASFLSTGNGRAALVSLGIVCLALLFMPWQALIAKKESDIKDHDQNS